MKLVTILCAFALAPLQAPKNPVAVIETSLGTIEVELLPDKAPITVKNFLDYIEKKFYDGLVFHRVIKDFMIQGGGLDKDLKRRETGKPIKNEADNGLKNERGTIAMARLKEVDSATSQFFINHKDNKSLDHISDDRFGYAVFGKVVKGMDVLDKIADVKTTTRGPYSNVPEEPVVIKSIRQKKAD